MEEPPPLSPLAAAATARAGGRAMPPPPSQLQPHRRRGGRGGGGRGYRDAGAAGAAGAAVAAVAAEAAAAGPGGGGWGLGGAWAGGGRRRRPRPRRRLTAALSPSSRPYGGAMLPRLPPLLLLLLLLLALSLLLLVPLAAAAGVGAAAGTAEPLEAAAEAAPTGGPPPAPPSAPLAAFHHIPLQRGALGRLSPLLLAEREPVPVPPLPPNNSPPLLRGGGIIGAKGAAMDVVGGSEAVYRPLTTLDPRLTAYFVRVGFGGGQELELLVDTGSPALLLPVAPSPELGSEPGRVIEEVPPSLSAPSAAATLTSRDSPPAPATAMIDPSLPLAPPPLARLNHTLANALLIPCADPRCTGRCHTPDAAHFCGPHGGSCTRSPLAPPPNNNNKPERGPGPGALAALGGAGSLPPHVPAEQCSFNWSYGAGQYASRATGVLMRGSVALGSGLVVPDATFGAILKASDGFYPTPAAAGILGLSFGNGSLCGGEHTCWPPLLDDLPGAGRDAFAICADGDKGGALVLGGVDEALAQAPIRYIPMLPPFAHYWVGVRDLRVNGASLLSTLPPPTDGGCTGGGGAGAANGSDSTIAACASRAVANETTLVGIGDDRKAMVDTGNSAACLPGAVFDALRKKLEEAAPGVAAIADAAGGRTVFDGYGRRMTDAELALLPRVELVLSGGGEGGAGGGGKEVVLSLEPQDYLHDESGYRYYKLIKYEHWAIGQTFLRKMYLVIDRAGRRVGFAPPIPGCAPPLPAARGGGGGGRA